MSSITLEDGEITNEEQNHFTNLNDERSCLNSVGIEHNGIGGGVVVATVSMTMEQRKEVCCITEVINSDCGSGGSDVSAVASNEVGVIDLSGGNSVFVGAGGPTICTTMSRTRTRQVTTASLSSACKGPLDIGIEVVFSDNKRAKFITKDSILPQGDAATTQKKRRVSITKKTSEFQPKDNAIKNDKFSILDFESNEDIEIDDDEMMFVRGASPPPKTSSKPEILAYICPSDKPSKSCKRNSKGKNNYIKRLPPNNRINKRKSKNQSKTIRQNKVSVSSNSDNQRVLTSAFSISTDGQGKTLELCKFFLENECFRGIDCEYMHEEFPCKYYYLGLECGEIDTEGNKTCKLFHGGPLSANIQNVLRRHLISAPTDVLGQKFCDNVLSQKTRDELLCMMDAFQTELKERNENIYNDCKPKLKVIQNEKSEESLKILRQKLCFLNEQQIESLQELNVQRPEEALNLTLWQLNSIGINKGIHLEAILATVLNGQDVDMRKLLPQPQCDKNLTEFVDDGVGDGDEEDEEKPLVIDETTIEENEEELTSKDNASDNLNDPLELSSRLDEETIRNATNETEQRIQDLKNSKASIEERKKEAFEVLNKLNELQTKYEIIKNKSEIKENIVKPNNVHKSPQTKKLKQNKMKNKAINLESKNKRKVCETANKHESAVNNDDNIVFNNEIQDQSKKEINEEANKEISCNSFFEVETALEELHNLSANKIPEREKEKFETFKVEENKCVIESKDIQMPVAETQTEKQVIIKIEKLDETNQKALAKILTDDGEKMTLRSQSKVITPSPVKLSPSIDKKTVTTKIVLNDVKVRRLKIPKKAVRKDSIVSKETLKQGESTRNSSIKEFESSPEESIEVTNVRPNAQSYTTQYTEDWEDCIEQSRSIPQQALNVVKSENLSATMNSIKSEPPSTDIESISHKQSKLSFKKSTVFQQRVENVETHNDLRQKIEDKKKYIEKEPTLRSTSPKNKNPFSNKTERLPKFYKTNSGSVDRVNKELYQPNYESEEDWDKDEENFNSCSNTPSTANNKNDSCSGSGSDSFLKDNTYTVAGVPDSPIDEDIKINSFSSCNKKAKRHFSFEMKVNESNFYDADDTVASPTLSPVVDEIASPTYPCISNLSDYTPAMEIDGHMSFPAMPYCLHEIKMPNIEVNKPESLDKLLRSNTVDPRILKYKEKGYLNSPAPPALSYFSSQQMSQYDPRRRTGIHTSPFSIDTQIQKQNPNMLLYRYLQQSPWYQGLMSTMKMQINHAIAELVRALNNFQKERLIDPSAIFDVFKLDCAVELIDTMRNIGIFIDANGFITEDKSFGLYSGARVAYSSPAPITSTYSFMPQLLPQPSHTKTLSYAPHGQAGVSVAMTPQVAESSFVSCYVEAPTFSQLTQRRQNSFPIPTNPATPPPTEDDDVECWNLQDDISPNDNPTAYCNNNNNRFRQMNGGAGCGGVNGRAGGAGAGIKRNDRSLMRNDNRRNGGSFNYGYRY